jgi:hypothetical protein
MAISLLPQLVHIFTIAESIIYALSYGFSFRGRLKAANEQLVSFNR